MTQDRDSIRDAEAESGRSILRSIVTVSALGALSLYPGGGFASAAYWESRDRETADRIATIDRRLQELEKLSEDSGTPEERANRLASRFFNETDESDLACLEEYFRELPSSEFVELTARLLELQGSILQSLSADLEGPAPNVEELLAESLLAPGSRQPDTTRHEGPQPPARELPVLEAPRGSVLDPVKKLREVDWECVRTLVLDARRMFGTVLESQAAEGEHRMLHAIGVPGTQY